MTPLLKLVIARSLLECDSFTLKVKLYSQSFVSKLKWLSDVFLILEPFLQEGNMVISNQTLPASLFESSGVIPSHPLPQPTVFPLSYLHLIADYLLWHLLPNQLLKLSSLVAIELLRG